MSERVSFLVTVEHFICGIYMYSAPGGHHSDGAVTHVTGSHPRTWQWPHKRKYIPLSMYSRSNATAWTGTKWEHHRTTGGARSLALSLHHHDNCDDDQCQCQLRQLECQHHHHHHHHHHIRCSDHGNWHHRHCETTKLTQELAVKLEQERDLRQWHSMANWEVSGETLCGKSEDGKSPNEQDWGKPVECAWALYTV